MEDHDEIIEKVRTLAEEAAEFEKKHAKDNFDIFNCLTRHHLEELHSKFIAYLLDPKASHGFEGEFLEKFINLLPAHGLSNGWESKVNSANVKREHGYFKNGRYRYIDVLIGIDDTFIAIENKVYAGEQQDQIKEYVEYCKDRSLRSKMYYLTLEGTQSNTAADTEYICISYREHILPWLDSVLSEKNFKEAYPAAYHHIKAYQDIIKRILNMPMDPLINMLKEKLLLEENQLIYSYANAIHSAVELTVNETRNKFFIELNDKLLTTFGNAYVLRNWQESEIQVNDLWRVERGRFKFTSTNYVLHLEDNKKVYFAVENNKTQLYYGLYAMSGDKFVDLDKDQMSKIQSMFPATLKFEHPEEMWFCWRDFYFEGGNYRIDDPSLNYLFIKKENLKELVERVINEVKVFLIEWEEIIKKYKSK